jgi:hypothetical protein
MPRSDAYSATLIFPAAAKPHVEQASSQRAEVGIFYRQILRTSPILQ